MAGRVERRLRPAATPGYWRRHVHKESARNTGSPMAWSAMTNRTPARDRSGALGWRRGAEYRGSRVTPVEGRDLSSRQTQQVVRDLEIGQPINSENCSETAEGVARESEGRSRVSLLRPVRPAPGSENLGSVALKLRFPGRNLIGVNVEMLGQLGYRPVALDGCQRHLRLEGR